MEEEREQRERWEGERVERGKITSESRTFDDDFDCERTIRG